VISRSAYTEECGSLGGTCHQDFLLRRVADRAVGAAEPHTIHPLTVARAVARYRKAVTELEAEARVELDELVARVQAGRAAARR
jgi:hypothetical protein